MKEIETTKKEMETTKKEMETRLKGLVRYFSRGIWREKTQSLADIYAIISGKKYEKRVISRREELIADANSTKLTDFEDLIDLPTVHTPTGVVLLTVGR